MVSAGEPRWTALGEGRPRTPQGTLEYRTIFAVGMLLFLGTFGLNLVSAWLRARYREEYA